MVTSELMENQWILILSFKVKEQYRSSDLMMTIKDIEEVGLRAGFSSFTRDFVRVKRSSLYRLEASFLASLESYTEEALDKIKKSIAEGLIPLNAGLLDDDKIIMQALMTKKDYLEQSEVREILKL